MSDSSACEIFTHFFKEMASTVHRERKNLEKARDELNEISKKSTRTVADQIRYESSELAIAVHSSLIQQAIGHAEHMWTKMRRFDFSNDEMNSEAELIELGLAKLDPGKDQTLYRTYDLKGWKEW